LTIRDGKSIYSAYDSIYMARAHLKKRENNSYKIVVKKITQSQHLQTAMRTNGRTTVRIPNPLNVKTAGLREEQAVSRSMVGTDCNGKTVIYKVAAHHKIAKTKISLIVRLGDLSEPQLVTETISFGPGKGEAFLAYDGKENLEPIYRHMVEKTEKPWRQYIDPYVKGFQLCTLNTELVI